MKLFGFPFSLNIIFWSLIGIVRFFAEEILEKRRRVKRERVLKKIRKAAICIPAHNEELVILKTIKVAKRLAAPEQIYVASDGSTDKTAKIARQQSCNVLELMPGQGKSKALTTLIKHFKLLQRYQFILFIDADTVPNKNFLKRSIRVFELNPRVVAIAGYAIPSFNRHKRIKISYFISAYRRRLYRILQLFLMYGQTWKYTNVNPVIPGFSSIYRTKILRRLRIDTPGIWIEDFNLAFQIHKKRLGIIAHHPKIFATYQDPATLSDYWKQVTRWNVGFFQTIRVHGMWPSFFWLALGFFEVELFLFSIFYLLLPLLATLLTVQYYTPIINPEIARDSYLISSNYITFWEILSLFFLLDYIFTCLVAIHDRKIKMLIYGFGFPFMHYLNSLILLVSLPKGILTKSKGSWTPAKRR